MSRSIRALIAGMAIIGVAHTAGAGMPKKSPGLNKILVRYTDLNLDDEADAATLLKRLSKAAKYVCSMPPLGAENLYLRYHTHACREGALHEAVARVDHPGVTALYRSTRPNSNATLASR
jgi:UrcA family protein